MNRTEIKHLYNRAGFGISAGKLDDLEGKSREQVVNMLFKESRESSYLPEPDFEMFDPRKFQYLSEEERQQIFRKRRAEFIQLNHIWLGNMVSEREVLREKMTFFWADHFACRSINVSFMQKYNNTLRHHALGNFGEMLRAVSKTPAMLQFLNGQQNRKGNPNENFAREVMELFSLGRGYYTEQDIKEAARAFTGWGFNLSGEFVYRKFWHDDNEKTIMGYTDNYDGDDVIDIILEQKQTAYFITEKIYRKFVNPEVDKNHVKRLAEDFYHSDYDISKMMRNILTSDWFYAPENQGTIVKSPVELIVGFHLHFGLDPRSRKAIQLQQALGQVLFFPPGVDGWPENLEWIDSSSMMVRVFLPEIFGNEGNVENRGKREANDIFDDLENVKNRQINWQDYESTYIEVADNPQRLIDLISSTLLAGEITHKNSQNIKGYISNAMDRTDRIKHASLLIASLPEYQIV